MGVPSLRQCLALVALAGLFTTSLAQSQQSCYFPNGTPDTTSVPCNSSATESHCCPSRGLCLSNGLCFLQTPGYSNRISRSSCTDRSWQSSNCPQVCADTYDGQGTTIWLGPENPDGAFCCGQPYNVTSQECILGTQGSTQPFNLAPGYVFFDREGKNSTDPAAFGIVSASASASGSATPTNTVALAASTGSTNSSSSDDDSCNTTAVGAGVGVPLGVLLIIAVGLLIWQWRKSSALQKQLAAMGSAKAEPAAQEVSQPYKDQSHGGWGGSMSGAVSPAPAYAAPHHPAPHQAEIPGHGMAEASAGMRPGELPATQQVIPELGN